MKAFLNRAVRFVELKVLVTSDKAGKLTPAPISE